MATHAEARGSRVRVHRRVLQHWAASFRAGLPVTARLRTSPSGRPCGRRPACGRPSGAHESVGSRATRGLHTAHRERCHAGNSHSAYTAPDSGPEQDTGRGAPRIHPANRARCTVAGPQRSARATAGRFSPAARRRRISLSRAARFNGAPVARSCPRFQPARFPPGHKRPSSAGSASPVEDGRADGTSSRERSTCTAAGCHGTARPSFSPIRQRRRMLARIEHERIEARQTIRRVSLHILTPARDLSHQHQLRIPARRRPARADRVSLSGHEDIKARPLRHLRQALTDVALALRSGR